MDLMDPLATEINGNSISAVFTDDALETISKTFASAIFRKFGRCFEI